MSLSGSLLFAVSLAATRAQPPCRSEEEAPPRLVVLLVVDQCRPDYLERFGPEFTGFFARLRDEGRWFVDGEQHHALTVTAAGHATLGTGRFPSHHGIVGNEFLDLSTLKMVGAADDRNAPPIGDMGGGHDASRLLSDGLGDWWQKSDPRAKVLGVSIKPRSAILPLGKGAHPAYWFDDRRRAFVTSATCVSELPEWVAQRATEDAYHDVPDTWEAIVADPERYTAMGCTADDTAGECRTGIPPARTFPHGLASDRPEFRSKAILGSPWTDDLVLDFARDAVEHEDLGSDDVPDFLSVGLSATDLIGHRYGPQSWEVAEQILHLDRALAGFVAFLEERTEGRCVFAVSSDHGVQAIPELAQAQGKPGARVDWMSLEPMVTTALEAISPELVGAALPIPEFGIHLRREAIERCGIQLEEVATELAAALREEPAFVDARSHAELQGPLAADDRLGELLRASSDGERAGDVLFVLPRGTIYTATTRVERTLTTLATTHGTPWPEDVRVPIVLLGPGIEAGVVEGRAWTVDMAPTLAHIAKVPIPVDLDGRVLSLSGSTASSSEIPSQQ